MTPVALVAVILAVARATRAVTTDDITANWRSRLTRRARRAREDGSSTAWYVVLIHCDWCVAFWLSIAAALIAKGTGLAVSWEWAGWCVPACAMAAPIVIKWGDGET